MSEEETTVEQTPEELNEEASRIRSFYRKIKENMIENRLEFTDPNSEMIENTLDSLDRVFKKVKKPRESVVDSNILLELATLGKERIKNVHCVYRSFSNIEFMDKVRAFMIGDDRKGRRTNRKGRMSAIEEQDDEDQSESELTPISSRNRQKNSPQTFILTKSTIQKFGTYAMNYFRIPPRPTFIIGSLQKEIVLKQKQTRKKEPKLSELEAKRTKIKELSAGSKENETNNTVSETERIFRILKRAYKKANGSAICLYEFVVNPNSFSRTIENIFYVSFLIKDGYARIYLDDDELPAIEPVLENEPESFNPIDIENRRKKHNVCVQSMVSLNKMQWREIVEVFNIKASIIPDAQSNK